MPKPAKCVSTERQQVYQNQFKKTVICRFFLADACKKGNKCTFAHSVEELQEVPDLRKTALCKLWKRGLCTLSGDRCPFAHNKRELRLSPAFAQMANRKRPENPTAGTPSTASALSPDLSEGSSQSSGSQPPSPRQQAEACSGGTQQPSCRTTPPPPPKVQGGSRKRQDGTGAAGLTKTEEHSSNLVGQTARVPTTPGLVPERLTELAAQKVPTTPGLVPERWMEPAALKAPDPQPADLCADLEPAFVQIPAFCGGGRRLPVAPVEDTWETQEQQALGVMPGGSDPRPIFVPLKQQGLATPSIAPAVSKLASTDWLQGPTPPVSGSSPMSTDASQCHVLAARHAAELRAIASEAEMKAAAFAQEAALLKQRAETAERELMLAARSAVVTLAGRLGEGGQGGAQ